MKVLVFLDSLVSAPRYIRLFDTKVSFVVTGRGSFNNLFIEVLRIFRRKEFKAGFAIIMLWIRKRVYFSESGLSTPDCLSFIKRLQPEIALHAMGVIYPRAVIDLCGLGILNAHIGKLPEFRGRSVMEWSLFIGGQTGVTVFFIDEGIDTGSPIVLFHPVDISNCVDISDAKRKLFDMAPNLYADALSLVGEGSSFFSNDLSQGYRYYEMSTLFRDALESGVFNHSL